MGARARRVPSASRRGGIQGGGERTEDRWSRGESWNGNMQNLEVVFQTLLRVVLGLCLSIIFWAHLLGRTREKLCQIVFLLKNNGISNNNSLLILYSNSPK